MSLASLKRIPVVGTTLLRMRRHYRKLTGVRRFARALEKTPGRRIVIGAAGIHDAGWIPSEVEFLNLLDHRDWDRFFTPGSIDALLAEHVWEHLSPAHGAIAAQTCYRYLKPGGYLRIAVPDGSHPDPAYIEAVRAGGTGPGADDHKVLYTYKSFASLFERVGFRCRLLEYFDEAGAFHFEPWNRADGTIIRSRRFDERNSDGKLHYTSLIMDAFKEPTANIGGYSVFK